MIALDIMTPSPIFCVADDLVTDVAASMAQADCGGIPIVDHALTKRVVGMVTDRDLALRVVAHGRGGNAVRAGDCMTAPAVTVQISATLDGILAAMRRRRVRRVPVVDPDGRLAGIISLSDICRCVSGATLGGLLEDICRPAGAEPHPLQARPRDYADVRREAVDSDHVTDHQKPALGLSPRA